jgi:hypothetical protein
MRMYTFIAGLRGVEFVGGDVGRGAGFGQILQVIVGLYGGQNRFCPMYGGQILSMWAEGAGFGQRLCVRVCLCVCVCVCVCLWRVVFCRAVFRTDCRVVWRTDL